MKKSIANIIVLSICLSCLVGCNRKKVVTTTHKSVSEDVVTEETSQTQVIDSKDDTDYVFVALNDVMTIYPGSAGSSLRSAIAAANCMKAADKIEKDKEKIIMDIILYSNSLNNEERETFIESINSVITTLDEFIIDWDNSKSILTDAGVAEEFKDYVPNKDKITPLKDALNDFVLEN